MVRASGDAVKAVDLAAGDVTGIGSLPHSVPAEAIDLVFDTMSGLPAAPSLPNASTGEYMLAQAAVGMAGVSLRPSGRIDVDARAVDADAPFDGDVLPWTSFGSTLAFLDAVGSRSGAIKLQLTGPVTLGFALFRAGVPAQRAFAAAGLAVRLRAAALIAEANRRAPNAPLVVFVDDPGMVAINDAGFPLDANATIDLVSGALAALEAHAVTGLHCCGPTDWRLAQQAGPQILSLPVDSTVVEHAGTFALHLERGGWIAWGAISTDGPVSAGADVPWRRLGRTWCDLVERGCDPVRLRDQALVTPACGLAHHSTAQAAHLLELTRDLGQRVNTQALGLRLTVGA